MDVATVVGISAVLAAVGMAQTPSPEKEATGQPELYVMTRHQSAQIPANAATCVARNGEAGQRSAQVQPLYGMEKVAVLVNNRPVGDTVAIAYFLPAGTGSDIEFVTTGYAEDRDTLVRQVLGKC